MTVTCARIHDGDIRDVEFLLLEEGELGTRNRWWVGVDGNQLRYGRTTNIGVGGRTTYREFTSLEGWQSLKEEECYSVAASFGDSDSKKDYRQEEEHELFR